MRAWEHCLFGFVCGCFAAHLFFKKMGDRLERLNKETRELIRHIEGMR